MLFKRTSRASPEVVFVVAKNVAGATLTAGYHCVWDVSASVDGVRVTQAATATLQAYAGGAHADIANRLPRLSTIVVLGAGSYFLALWLLGFRVADFTQRAAE